MITVMSEGLLVIGLIRMLARPFCTMILVDHSACAIGVGKPDNVEAARQCRPWFKQKLFYYFRFNRDKEGITLDSRDAENRAIIDDVLGNADVVTKNFPPAPWPGMRGCFTGAFTARGGADWCGLLHVVGIPSVRSTALRNRFATGKSQHVYTRLYRTLPKSDHTARSVGYSGLRGLGHQTHPSTSNAPQSCVTKRRGGNS